MRIFLLALFLTACVKDQPPAKTEDPNIKRDSEGYMIAPFFREGGSLVRMELSVRDSIKENYARTLYVETNIANRTRYFALPLCQLSPKQYDLALRAVALAQKSKGVWVYTYDRQYDRNPNEAPYIKVRDHAVGGELRVHRIKGSKPPYRCRFEIRSYHRFEG